MRETAHARWRGPLRPVPAQRFFLVQFSFHIFFPFCFTSDKPNAKVLIRLDAHAEITETNHKMLLTHAWKSRHTPRTYRHTFRISRMYRRRKSVPKTCADGRHRFLAWFRSLLVHLLFEVLSVTWDCQLLFWPRNAHAQGIPQNCCPCVYGVNVLFLCWKCRIAPWMSLMLQVRSP